MVEGSFIDSGGHANNTIQIVEEVLDLDRAIGKALDFAAKDDQTLIVVASDHETGGMTINGGSFESGMVKGIYNRWPHRCHDPHFRVRARGFGIRGIMENTDIHAKIYKLLFEKNNTLQGTSISATYTSSAPSVFTYPIHVKGNRGGFTRVCSDDVLFSFVPFYHHMKVVYNG